MAARVFDLETRREIFVLSTSTPEELEEAAAALR
jgi:hypothetical protein